MEYKSTWNSLCSHKTPEWFRNAKFGIYTHWGIYSVPACGPNGSWYGSNMYHVGNSQYEYHCKTYGSPSKFGYKDFIPMFTGEKFNAREWAELFKKSGARFAGPVGEHHDGFSMWNSRVNPWNSYNMGPRRDVVAELEIAIREVGMKYMVAFHHAENWRFYPHWLKEYDVSRPEYSSLYGELHNMEWESDPDKVSAWGCWDIQEKPSRNFLDNWLFKIKEVLNSYNPDVIWFDFGLDFIQEHYKTEFLSYFYNKAERENNEVVAIYKVHDLVPGSGLIDLEQGSFNKMTYHEWITDTTIDDGSGWGYVKDIGYKSSTSLIHYLVDNVSKNGYLLLNVGPKPNGEIPEAAQNILLEMGEWLKINGEAIYDTTVWLKYGEGPTQMSKTGGFSEMESVVYTSEDIRFTCKDNYLFAIMLGWPSKKKVTIKSLNKLYNEEIISVSMLGLDQHLTWKLTMDGLTIDMPDTAPCKHAYVFKIERDHPFDKAKREVRNEYNF